VLNFFFLWGGMWCIFIHLMLRYSDESTGKSALEKYLLLIKKCVWYIQGVCQSRHSTN
jgi:hypothetical protein